MKFLNTKIIGNLNCSKTYATLQNLTPTNLQRMSESLFGSVICLDRHAARTGESRMRNNTLILLAALVALLITNTGCRGGEDSPHAAAAPQGGVDSGGGNTVANPNTGERVLLDLAEDIDKQPFDFDIRNKVLRLNETMTPEESKIAFSKWSNFQKIHTLDYIKALIGDDEEFFIWAISTSLSTNAELSSPLYDRSSYNVHVSAYQLQGDHVVTNVRYALTDNELKDVGDTGVVHIVNPETKKQIAVQDSNGFVLINRSEFEKLDADSKMALKLHESLVYLVMKFNPKLLQEKGTEPIRLFVRNFFNHAFYSESVSPELVRASYKALGLPVIKPDYSVIGKISDAVTDPSLECHLENTNKQSSNFHFTKDSQPITNDYSMDLAHYMKFQIYLVKNGLCVFKPSPCRLETYNYQWEKDGSVYRYFIGDKMLPEGSTDVLKMKTTILKQYQDARLCQ